MKRAHWCVKWQNEKGQNETKWEDRRPKSILLNDCKQKQIATVVKYSLDNMDIKAKISHKHFKWHLYMIREFLNSLRRNSCTLKRFEYVNWQSWIREKCLKI